MKNHIMLKFIAVILCAAFLLGALVSGVGIVILAGLELYSQTPEELYAGYVENDFWWIANRLAREQAAKTYSNATEEEREIYFDSHYAHREVPSEDLWYYRVFDENGRLVASRYDAKAVQDAVNFSFYVDAPQYPMVISRVPLQDPEPTHAQGTSVPIQVPGEESLPTEATVEPTQPDLSGYEHTMIWDYMDENGVEYRYTMGVLRGPDYEVELYLLPDAFEVPGDWTWELARLGYTYRFQLFWVLGGSLLLFALTLVYLCCAAGRKPKSTEVRPAGLNRIPLDLYLGGLILLVSAVAVMIADVLYWPSDAYDPMWLIFAGFGAAAYGFCLLIVGFLFACAAQMKVPGGWWLKHTVVGGSLVLCAKLINWFFSGMAKGLGKLQEKTPGATKSLAQQLKRLFEKLKKLVLWLYETAKKILIALFLFTKKCLSGLLSALGKGIRLLWRWLKRFAILLPMTWQWLLVSMLLVIIIAIGVMPRQSSVGTLGCIGICLVVVMYCAHCFGTLLESTKRMSQGDLDTKVDDHLLLGCFQEYATYLNALAGVATEAAKQQMKSERMKAELVTNVSHDIKTPLTSIINYVDLMQKAQSPEEAQSHLEVLERQSQRLKKLIEDLMEMSKASTGNMAVDLKPLDAVEAINQALGEFSEKLEQAQLAPVFVQPEGPVMMTADGRLTWRVLSNLLSNAVKYALPGTRLYIDLAAVDGKVLISLKNISREQLNVSSEELMERFVRGDASRNTEGSGLGLNIAQSLMELQKGRLQLLVDGDLFKATLFFPDCS